MVDVHKYLKWALYVDELGRYYRCNELAGGVKRFQKLSELDTRSREIDVDLIIEPGGKEVKFPAALMTVGRSNNSYVYWSLAAVYEHLQMTVWQGKASKWVSRSWPMWVCH